MLSDMLKKKQTYIFNVLDFDGNGFIEEVDFIGIGENLCIIRGEELDTPESNNILELCKRLWADLRFYTDENRDDKCTLDEWLNFVDNKLAGNFNDYAISMVNNLFDLYDVDSDGQISLDEYLDLFMSFRLETSLIAKSYKSINKNRDQHITKEEFIEAARLFLQGEQSVTAN
jgi:Ca2+-binding EF-hand superfamily protein